MKKTITDEEADKLLEKKIELVDEFTELFEEFFDKELRESQINKLMNTEDDEIQRMIALFKKNKKQTEPEEEIWKPCNIINCSNYEVSSLGRLRNRITGKYLKDTPHKHIGYIINGLVTDNKEELTIQRGRLVMMVFKPCAEMSIKGELDVDHLNNIKTDNRLENLEWVSHRENCIRVKDRNYNSRKKNGYYQVKDDEFDPEIKHIRYFKQVSDITDNKTDQNTIQKCMQYNRYSVKFRSMFYFYEDIPEKYKEMYIEQLKNENEEGIHNWCKNFE